MKMRVSIIIPIYKVEFYIERCLLSVCCQTYPNIEVVLVNDASPDKSMELARGAVSGVSFPVICVEHEINRGLSAARNSGIQVATGDYLYFLDSDDELVANAIELFVKNAKMTNADVVIGNYKSISDEKTYVSQRYANQMLYKNQDIILAFVDGSIPVMAWNKMIRKDFLISKSLYFKEGLVNEDELWAFMIAYEARTIALLGTLTYIYYVRQGSIMTAMELQRLESSIAIYREMCLFSEKRSSRYKLMSKFLDRFAFKRYIAIMQIPISMDLRKKMYRKIREVQVRTPGCRVMRYVFHAHLLLPPILGFWFMRATAWAYAKR